MSNMHVIYVFVHHNYSDKHRNIVRNLASLLCNGDTNIVQCPKGEVIVGTCTDDNYVIAQYLSESGALTLGTEETVEPLCPEAIVIGTAMWPCSPA